MKVGYFPFKPGGNPYQTLFAKALEEQGLVVDRIPPTKYFPLSKAASRGNDILQLDWPHDWYTGRNRWAQWMKRVMYEVGLAKLAQVPVVWTVHNLVAHDSENPDYDRRMIQKLINSCDGLICLSSSARRVLHETYWVPPSIEVQLVHHGHYMDVYPNDVSKSAARAHLEIPEDAKVVLSLGRILPYKGLENLLAAFGETTDPRARLLIAGSCSSADYLGKLSALARRVSRYPDQVRIVDRFISDDELQHYFNAADIVVLPFVNVLNSGSLLLAMGFGKTVIAPNIGSIAEIAYRKAWIPYGETDGSLSESLQNAFSNQNSVTASEIIEFVGQNYSWNEVGRSVATMYFRLVGKAHGRVA